jgi:hypothetical protein
MILLSVKLIVALWVTGGPKQEGGMPGWAIVVIVAIGLAEGCLCNSS